MSPTVSLLLVCAVQAGGDASTPRSIRLFDRMEQASVERTRPLPPAEAADATPEDDGVRHELAFEAGFSQRIWFGRRAGRELRWEGDASPLVAVTAEGGVSGGALRIGPGIAEDRSCAALLFKALPLTRYVVRGRVRFDHHPAADEASAREVVQVVEHEGDVDDPTRDPWGGSVLEVHRASRLRDASGWDRFEIEIPLTYGVAGSLELRLLHRSGGSLETATWFDDVAIEERRMSEAQTWLLFTARHRPQDGQAGTTPWRLRVDLPTADQIKLETRDALLLPPPRRLSIPVTVAPAASQPRLRFAYGMLPEAFGVPGDGARITVGFAQDGGAPVELARCDFDPKNDAAQRCWLAAQVDLAPVAGQSGAITFESSDLGEPDPYDAVVLATPRIESCAEPESRWNVLVMASDTLRADRLSAFGYARPTSPNLERLAREGVRFSCTRSQAPWTLPSFSSILTSMYPSEHGAGRGGHDEWTPLAPGATTLAHLLAAAGWETAGITANHLISPEYGLDQGFESYSIPGDLEWRKLGMESVELDAPLVVRFLEEHRATPFFLFWHMMDPHLPYTTKAQFREEFAAAGYSGRFQGDPPVVPFQVLDPRPGRRWFTQEGPPKPPPLTDADRKFVSDYYDAEIGEIDAAIGTVLDALRRTGLWERTIVAMVADHGEGLGEHGHYHHGYTLFEDQVRIPLIVRVPGRAAGAVRDEPTASIDLAPTILGALGIAAPPSFRGRDLLAATGSGGGRGDAAAEPRRAEIPVFLEYPSYDSSAEKGVILGDFKYLHDPWFHTEALYDTRSDPLETKDVRAARPDLVKRGRALLDEFRWERLQQGRFHLRVAGRAGAKVTIEVTTDDLFDANFAARPLIDEHDFALDFDRQHLVLSTTMASDRLELVCWCRGENLTFTVSFDGEPIDHGIRLGQDADPRSSPLSIARDAVPSVAGATLAAPSPLQALLWMEPGTGDVAPIVPTPQEAEMLRALGYAR